MTGEKRRQLLIEELSRQTVPASATFLAAKLKVSRQVIVQDVALLRASGLEIHATNRGYLMEKHSSFQRVFKTIHDDKDTQKELQLIVDSGGFVKDVFVYHKVYGEIRAELNLSSRLEIKQYLETLQDGSSSLLKNVTHGYHYHTVIAKKKETLDFIESELKKEGFLAPLLQYEPNSLQRSR